jgi:translation initiation factor 2D
VFSHSFLLLHCLTLIHPQLKSQASLRSSDRRKIAQQIIQDLSYSPPSPTDEGSTSEVSLRNQLLPDGSSSAKFTTTHGPDLAPVSGNIYFGTHADEQEERPLWVRVDRQSPELSPTVFTLWKNPTLLPLLHTPENVVERLFDGADLMTPGLVGPPFPEGAKVGALVGIASTDRPTVPIAVGVCEINVAGLEKAVGEKGRAVRILHWVGDEVYKLGGSPAKVPKTLEVPRSQPDAQVTEMANAVGKLEITEAKEAVVEGNVSSGEEEIRQLETKEIDAAFYNAALYGFYDHWKNEKISALDFPLSSSAFISMLVHPYLPPASQFPPYNLLQNEGPHPSLQLKKSSWKNTAKFLKHLHANQLVATKVRNGGELVVMDINWQNNEVQSFTPYKIPEAPKADNSGPTTASGGGEKGGTVKIEALYRPNGKGIKFFEEINAGFVHVLIYISLPSSKYRTKRCIERRTSILPRI